MEMEMESDSFVISDNETDKLLRKGGPRIEAGYPGSGYIASGDERVRGEDGVVKTKNGLECCIPTRATLEFLACLFFFFFGTLGSVNSSAVAIAFASPDSEHRALVANPVATFVSAVVWGGCLFLVLRAVPGIALNPFVVLNQWFFSWKKDGKPFKIDHVVHSLTETFVVIGAQFAGGFAAIVLVYFVQGRDTGLIGEARPSAIIGNEAWIIVYEGTAAFLFMSLVNFYSRPRRDVNAHEQSMFIGAVNFFLVMSFNAYTGAVSNPIKALVPGIVRSIFSGVSLRTSLVYYIIGQASGFATAGALAWAINTRAHLHRYRAITTTPKEL